MEKEENQKQKSENQDLEDTDKILDESFENQDLEGKDDSFENQIDIKDKEEKKEISPEEKIIEVN